MFQGPGAQLTRLKSCRSRHYDEPKTCQTGTETHALHVPQPGFFLPQERPPSKGEVWFGSPTSRLNSTAVAWVTGPTPG